jgi:hypothetical protein
VPLVVLVLVALGRDEGNNVPLAMVEHQKDGALPFLFTHRHLPANARGCSQQPLPCVIILLSRDSNTPLH